MKNKIIAICDDQEVIALELQEIVREIQEKWHCEWTVKVFLSGKELLQKIRSIDVVLLDIDMPQEDGIQVGEKILQNNSKCRIIMETAITDRYKDAFRIQAYRFVTKPYDRLEIEEALNFLRYNLLEEEIEVFQKRTSCVLCMRDISIIRAYNGYTEFIAKGQLFRKDMSLNEVAKKLNQKIFCQINRQYIVNMQHITKYTQEEIWIRDKRFSVSKRRRKEVHQRYVDFDLHYR